MLPSCMNDLHGTKPKLFGVDRGLLVELTKKPCVDGESVGGSVGVDDGSCLGVLFDGGLVGVLSPDRVLRFARGLNAVDDECGLNGSIVSEVNRLNEIS